MSKNEEEKITSKYKIGNDLVLEKSDIKFTKNLKKMSIQCHALEQLSSDLKTLRKRIFRVRVITQSNNYDAYSALCESFFKKISEINFVQESYRFDVDNYASDRKNASLAETTSYFQLIIELEHFKNYLHEADQAWKHYSERSSNLNSNFLFIITNKLSIYTYQRTIAKYIKSIISLSSRLVFVISDAHY